MEGPSGMPPTTYALVLLHADGSTAQLTVTQAPGRLYSVGDTIEARGAQWRVVDFTLGDRVPVLTCAPALPTDVRPES